MQTDVTLVSYLMVIHVWNSNSYMHTDLWTLEPWSPCESLVSHNINTEWINCLCPLHLLMTSHSTGQALKMSCNYHRFFFFFVYSNSLMTQVHHRDSALKDYKFRDKHVLMGLEDSDRCSLHFKLGPLYVTLFLLGTIHSYLHFFFFCSQEDTNVTCCQTLNTEDNKGPALTFFQGLKTHLHKSNEYFSGRGKIKECGHLRKQSDIVQKLFFPLLITDNIGPGFPTNLGYTLNQQVWHPCQRLFFFLIF